MRLEFNKLFQALALNQAKPLAEKYGLDFKELSDGVYEIRGRLQSLRIRRGTGHLPSILVTMRDNAAVSSGIEDLSDELGLRHVVEFQGGVFIGTESAFADFEKLFSNVLIIAEKYAFPYLTTEVLTMKELWGYFENKFRGQK